MYLYIPFLKKIYELSIYCEGTYHNLYKIKNTQMDFTDYMYIYVYVYVYINIITKI